MLFHDQYFNIFKCLQVGLLNVDGYYNSLLSFIDKAVDEGFVTPTARGIIVSAQTAHELLSKLEVYNRFLEQLSKTFFQIKKKLKTIVNIIKFK